MLEEVEVVDWLDNVVRLSLVRGKKFVFMWKLCVFSWEGEEEEVEKLRLSDYGGIG